MPSCHQREARREAGDVTIDQAFSGCNHGRRPNCEFAAGILKGRGPSRRALIVISHAEDLP